TRARRNARARPCQSAQTDDQPGSHRRRDGMPLAVFPAQESCCVLRVANSLKPASAEPQVRLEVRAFRPFVPGIHEDNSLITEILLTGLADDALQPRLECTRRCSMKHVGFVLAAGCVVPGWHHATKARVGGDRLAKVAPNDLMIVADGPRITRIELFTSV